MCMAVPATLLQYHTVWLVTGPPPCRRSESERQKERERAQTFEQQKHLLLTWPKTINVAASLLYCRFVHGTVHPLYGTDMLITTHLARFKHFNTVKSLLWHATKPNQTLPYRLLVGNSLVQYYFTPEFYSIWFYSWRTDIDGHPGERKGLLLR